MAQTPRQLIVCTIVALGQILCQLCMRNMKTYYGLCVLLELLVIVVSVGLLQQVWQEALSRFKNKRKKWGMEQYVLLNKEQQYERCFLKPAQCSFYNFRGFYGFQISRWMTKRSKQRRRIQRQVKIKYSVEASKDRRRVTGKQKEEKTTETENVIMLFYQVILCSLLKIWIRRGKSDYSLYVH